MPNNERTMQIPLVRTPPNSSPELPDEPRQEMPSQGTSSASKETGLERLTTYEFIDSRELARRLTVPTSWIRDQVRARSQDPLPHVNLGKYVRFLWGSPALELW